MKRLLTVFALALPHRLAARQLEAWWRVHRTATPNAVREEVERAMQLIALQPRIGQRATNVELVNVRRIHLSRIWHHLYYRINDSPEQIELLALWSESRGEGPPISRHRSPSPSLIDSLDA